MKDDNTEMEKKDTLPTVDSTGGNEGGVMNDALNMEIGGQSSGPDPKEDKDGEDGKKDEKSTGVPKKNECPLEGWIWTDCTQVPTSTLSKEKGNITPPSKNKLSLLDRLGRNIMKGKSQDNVFSTEQEREMQEEGEGKHGEDEEKQEDTAARVEKMVDEEHVGQRVKEGNGKEGRKQ